MLIDWITCRIPLEALSDSARTAVLSIGDRIQRICSQSGEVIHTTCAWDSIRSDSHQIAARVGSDLWIQGSPARVMGSGCSVFGSGASAALDIAGCVERMTSFVAGFHGVRFPAADQWKVSRVDVTGNLDLGSLADVRTALGVLRNTSGGRYSVRPGMGDTAYFGGKSRLRRGKAYAKGPHLESLMRRACKLSAKADTQDDDATNVRAFKPAETYTGKHYSASEIAAAMNLLRLELTLGAEFLRKNDWRNLTPSDLCYQWEDYFGRMIGDADMTNDDLKIQQRIYSAAETEGQGKAAYCQWVMIKQNGIEFARSNYSRTSWYRNMKTLRAAGFGDADLSAGHVVQFRRKVMDARLVRSWSELAA